MPVTRSSAVRISSSRCVSCDSSDSRVAAALRAAWDPTATNGEMSGLPRFLNEWTSAHMATGFHSWLR